MKQLILNFLFFVAAAFIFIQCAKFFPTSVKTITSSFASQGNPEKSNSKNAVKAATFAPGEPVIAPIFNTWTMGAYFNKPVFPLNMMEYIKGYSVLNNYHFGLYNTDVNGRTLFYNPYLNNTYSQLFTKQNGRLRASNHVGDKK
jgi:hypothetical protein